MKKLIIALVATAAIAHADITVNLFTGYGLTDNSNADAVLLLTEWKIYSNINWNLASTKMRKPAWLFDARSVVDKDKIISSGINFWRIGDGSID